MGTLKIYYDKLGKTLTVWFSDPSQEFITEETGEGILLMKDHAGTVIGFERLNYEPTKDKIFKIEEWCS